MKLILASKLHNKSIDGECSSKVFSLKFYQSFRVELKHVLELYSLEEN